jgi:beta-lactamase regulating signal transducer with metallopeptidase domain
MMEQALIEYLVNAGWQLPLLAGSAWLLLRLLRPKPEIQHCVWLAVLGLALTLPLSGMRKTSAPPTGHFVAAVAPGPRADSLPGSLRLAPGVTRWLVRLYLASVAVGLIRIAWAGLAAKRLVDNSRATCLCRRDMEAFEHCGRRLGVKLPRLLTSDVVSSPMIVGIRAPALLLPAHFACLAENEIKAALCHELAHIQRRDYLVNLVCQVAALPLAWHPAMHAVQQRIRTTREMVCDAIAAQAMDSQVGYAKCLLALAHSMLGELNAQSLGLFSKNTLEERVMQLTEIATMKARATVARVTTGLAVMIATGTIAATLHVTPTMAQSEAAAPAKSQAQAPRAEPMQKNAGGDQSTQELDSLRRQLAKAEREAADSRKQLEDLRQQLADMKEVTSSPEFKQRMEDAQRQMKEATEMMNSPEFKQQMERTQKQLEEMDQKLREAFPPSAVTPDR